MNKLRILSIVFIVAAVIALIPLTIEVFGDKTPEAILFFTVIAGIGLFGSLACTIVRCMLEEKEIGR